MAHEPVVRDALPQGCDRSYRRTPTVGEFRRYLADNLDCRLRHPVYHVAVKWFDAAHPIVLNYEDSTDERQRWAEVVGNVHAVVLYVYVDQGNIKEGSVKTGKDGKMERSSYLNPVPARNGRKPVDDAGGLLYRLGGCDSDFHVVIARIGDPGEIDAAAHKNDVSTVTTLWWCADYYDGYGWHNEYSEYDGDVKITGIFRGDRRRKIEIRGEVITDRHGSCTDPIVYTNVLRSVVDRRREEYVQKRLEWLRICDEVRRGVDPAGAARGVHSLVEHDGNVVLVAPPSPTS